MSKFDAWALAFPEAKAEYIVESLVLGFRQLASGVQGPYMYAESEPHITELLAVYLESTKSDRPTVRGHWHYELCSNTLDLKDRRRRDIVFTTVHNDAEEVVMIFECKKIDGPDQPSRHRAHLKKYRTEGIARFAQGSYARIEPIGFMVSFTNASTENTVPAIQRAFGATGWPVAMYMREFSPGKYWRSPSQRFSTYASFETQHLRPKPFPHLTLYHIHLPFS